jgi:delta1-piperideine-2-carboxylate reductase
MSHFLTFPELRDILAEIFRRAGMSLHNAGIVAGVIAEAERDGAHSHGLMRVPGYLSTLASGWIDGQAVPFVIDLAPGVVSADARNGFAQVALAAARGLLLDKARANGVAALLIRNSHHFAALWPDVEPIANEGFVAIACVNTRSRILVWDGRQKTLGTNPMAFACPRRDTLPLVWDQASSVVAQGEVLMAARSGHKLPDGAGRDAQGQPTNDPEAVLAGGAIAAFAGHKGSSLALMIEVLAAALTGGRFGFEDLSADYPGAQTSQAGQCVIAIDPLRSAGSGFRERIEQLLDQIVAGGVSRLPADRRYRQRARAAAHGIEIRETDWQMLNSLMPASQGLPASAKPKSG